MIKAFALDIDGVFTDGSILCTTDGDLLRVFPFRFEFICHWQLFLIFQRGTLSALPLFCFPFEPFLPPPP